MGHNFIYNIGIQLNMYQKSKDYIKQFKSTRTASHIEWNSRVALHIGSKFIDYLCHFLKEEYKKKYWCVLCLTVILEILPCPFTCLQVPCKTNPTHYWFSRTSIPKSIALSVTRHAWCKMESDKKFLRWFLFLVWVVCHVFCMWRPSDLQMTQHGSIINQFGCCLPLMLLFFACFRDLGSPCPHLCNEVFPWFIVSRKGKKSKIRRFLSPVTRKGSFLGCAC